MFRWGIFLREVAQPRDVSDFVWNMITINMYSRIVSPRTKSWFLYVSSRKRSSTSYINCIHLRHNHPTIHPPSRFLTIISQFLPLSIKHLNMKSFAIAAVLSASAVLVTAQDAFMCPKANGTFCVGASLASPGIIHCTNSVPTNGSCSEMWVAYPPTEFKRSDVALDIGLRALIQSA